MADSYEDSDYAPASFKLCLVLECSGKMQPYIDAVRSKVIGVLEEIKEKYPTCEVQIGLTTYRDVNEQTRPKVLHYTDNFKKVGDFLKALSPEGGNPGPKDVCGGFHRGLYKLLSISDAKLMVHIGAAPCHGKEYHSLENDDYPKGFKKDVDWNRLIKDIVGMGEHYLFLKVSSDTDQMFAKLREIAESKKVPGNEVIFRQEAMCKGGPIAIPEEPKPEPKEEVKKETKKGKTARSTAKKDGSESPERSKEREEGEGRPRRSARNATKEKERSNSRDRKKSPKGKGNKGDSEMVAEKMMLSKEDQEYFAELLKNTIIECMEKERERLRGVFGPRSPLE